MNNRTVATQWVNNQSQNYAGSNLFSEGNKIYSYGYHFLIAEIVKDKEANFNSRKYSHTTARHKSHVKQALLASGYSLNEIAL